jgi:hypothetical protein
MYNNIDKFFQGFAEGGGVGFERGRGSMYDSYPVSREEEEEEKEREERSFPDYGPPSVPSPIFGDSSDSLGGDDRPSFPDYSPPSVPSSPSAYDVFQNLPLNMGQPVSFDQDPVNTNVGQLDYSGDVDRYSIPVGEYIPEDLGIFEPFVPPNLRFNPRKVADSLGFTDLSNFNPITGLMRGRDAAARISDPERYSPTGRAELGDYVEAGIETAIPALTMGLGSALRQPIKQTIGNVFGLDIGSPATANVPMTSDTMNLYHGSEYDFLPSVEVTLPSGEVKRLDDNMFDMVSPLGMQFFREGMDVSETPFARTFEQLGYPKGTKITRADPYGRFRTNMIGTGEGGYQAGSEGAQTGAGGAMVGKGIYMAQRPNIAQSYRYTNTNSSLPFVPYEDSFGDGVGQKTIEAAQEALADKYGDIETAREVFEAGTDPNFGEITPNMVFEYTSPAEVQDKWLADRNRAINDVSEDERLMRLIPYYMKADKSYGGVSPSVAADQNIRLIKSEFRDAIRDRLEKLDPEMKIDNIKVQLRRMPEGFILGPASSAKATLSRFYDDLYLRNGIIPPNEDRSVFRNQEEFDQTVEDVVFLLDKELQFNNEILAAQNDMIDSVQANDDLAKVVNLDVEQDIPGNLYISEIESGDLGRSLETNQPIDLGTLNDMVEIFGKEGVEDMFDRAGFPLKPGNIGREGLVELSDDPRGFKYAVPEFSSRERKPTEEIFAPRTVDEMNQLARGGYSNLRFLDAASRSDAKNPTYNYVFFGEDVMPKIVDKKQDGGLVGIGLGSV